MHITYLLLNHVKNVSKSGSAAGNADVFAFTDRQTIENRRSGHISFLNSFISFPYKKIAAWLLILCICVSAYPISAFAEIKQNSNEKSTESNSVENEKSDSDLKEELLFSESESSSEESGFGDTGTGAVEKSSQRGMNVNSSDPDEDVTRIDPGKDLSLEEDAKTQSDSSNKKEEMSDSYFSQDEKVEPAESSGADSSNEFENGSGERAETVREQTNSGEEDNQIDIIDSDLDSATDRKEKGSENEESDLNSDLYSVQGENEISTVQTDEEKEIPDSEEQQEILFEEELKIVQDGDFVTEHFGVSSGRKKAPARSNTDSLRSLISAAMGEYQTEVSIVDLGFTRTNDIDTVRSVYRSCIRGNRFYITGGFSYYINEDDVITRIKIIYNSAYTDANGDPDGEKIQKALRKFDKRVDAALEYIEQGRNVLERILLAHDWIIRECDYDYENNLANSVPSESYSAYGCMINGIAVCNGYALAYSYLLEEMGYESYILSSDSMNHAWNLVRIDGEWMHVDVTWDDPVFSGKKTWLGFENEDYSDEGFVNHIYFLKSDEEIENLGHYGWRLQNSEFDLPSSSAAGLYDGTVFFDLSGSAFNYLGGRFYFSDDGILTISDDLWGKNRKTVSIVAETAYYPHVFEDKLYYTDLQDIYCYSLDDGEILLLQGGNKEVSELTVKSGQLVYVLLDGDISERYTLSVANIRPPEAVRIIKYVPYAGRIKLVWEASEDADGYILSYALMSENKFKTLKNITSAETLTYSHKTVEAYVQYKIRAYKTYGGEKIYSDYSETITAGTLPGKVQNLAAIELTSGKTKFTWDDINDVEGFVLYESGDNGATWKSIKTLSGDQGSYKVGLKTEDKVYRARAFRELGGKKYYGGYSDPVKVYVKPEAPAELTVTHISDKKDRIDWTTSEGADGYIISRSTDGSTYTVLKTFADGFTDSYIAVVSEGFQYLYRICAYRLVDGIKIRSKATQGK